MKRLLVIIVIGLFILPVFAQNNDKPTSPLSERELLSKIIQATTESMRVIPVNYPDAGNSTTTNITANGTFTGTATNLLTTFGGVQTISIFGLANKASATNGLKIRYSTTGTTWQDSVMYTVGADSAFHILLEPKAKYYQMVYTNGADSVTSITIQTILQSAAKVIGLPSGASSSALQDSLFAYTKSSVWDIGHSDTVTHLADSVTISGYTYYVSISVWGDSAFEISSTLAFTNSNFIPAGGSITIEHIPVASAGKIYIRKTSAYAGVMNWKMSKWGN